MQEAFFCKYKKAGKQKLVWVEVQATEGIKMFGINWKYSANIISESYL